MAPRSPSRSGFHRTGSPFTNTGPLPSYNARGDNPPKRRNIKPVSVRMAQVPVSWSAWRVRNRPGGRICPVTSGGTQRLRSEGKDLHCPAERRGAQGVLARIHDAQDQTVLPVESAQRVYQCSTSRCAHPIAAPLRAFLFFPLIDEPRGRSFRGWRYGSKSQPYPIPPPSGGTTGNPASLMSNPCGVGSGPGW